MNNILTENGSKKVYAAKQHMLMSRPLHANMMFQLEVCMVTHVPMIRPDGSKYLKAIPAMATDGIRLFQNPHYINTATLGHIQFVTLHEMLHVMFQHPARFRDARKNIKGLKEHLWHTAEEWIVNEYAEKEGLTLPEDACADRRGVTKSMSTLEEKYKYLCSLPPGDQKDPNILPPEGGPGSGSEGGEGGQGTGQSDSALSKSDIDMLADMMKNGTMPDIDVVDDGSDVIDAPPSDMSDEDREVEAQSKIVRAAEMTRSSKPGSLPGFLDELLEDILNPKVPWQDVLRPFMQMSVSQDAHWIPPASRFISSGMYLPSRKGLCLNNGIIVADVSGSMWNALVQVFAEISSILETFDRVSVTYMPCDTRVIEEEVRELTEQDLPLKMRKTGGGGTSFEPPFIWVEEQGLQPEWLVYLTDAYGTFPKHDPGYPVLWAFIDTDRTESPFGTVIRIDDI